MTPQTRDSKHPEGLSKPSIFQKKASQILGQRTFTQDIRRTMKMASCTAKKIKRNATLCLRLGGFGEMERTQP
eukprot:13091255-Alexandrium_andersonii.AAC.1